MIYQPREDSFLLKKYVSRYSKGIVLDMGTGSGIQAEEAAKKANKVIAVDINKEVIDYCKKNIKNKKISFIKSDLFGFKPKIKFDLIIFNPPYLPRDKDDKRIEGGKHGYEIIKRFLKEVKKYLKPGGKILLLFSSLTNKEMVDSFIKKNLFKFKLLEKKKFFFETLYVYLLFKENFI